MRATLARMRTLVANLSTKAKRLTWDGREYLVAPATSIREGVVKGSEGPLFYSGEEIKKSAKSWNGIPIVVNHPKSRDGKYVSARDPEILERSGIGFLARSNYGEGLTHEAWFDVEKTRKVEPRILNALEAGDKLEVSTGLDLDAHKVRNANEAIYNSTPYEFDTRNYRPDHLAILPDDTGACSIKAGCGVFNSEGSTSKASLWESLKSYFSLSPRNDLSHSQIRHALAQQLASRYTQNEPSCYIRDVFDGYFIYEMGTDTYRLDYEASESGVTLSDKEPEKVQMTIEYVTANQLAEDDMSKLTDTQRLEATSFIVANCDCWKGEQAIKTLNGMPDELLTKVKDKVTKDMEKSVANAVPNTFVDSLGNTHAFDHNAKAWATKQKEVPVAPPITPPSQTAPADLATLVANTVKETLAKELGEDLARLREGSDLEKGEIIGRLVANKTDEVKERLRKKYASFDLTTLRDMDPGDDTDDDPKFGGSFLGATGGRKKTVANKKKAAAPDDEEPDPLDFAEYEYSGKEE